LNKKKGKQAMNKTNKLWLAWFVIGLKTGWSYAKKEEDSEKFVAVMSNRVEGLTN